MSLTISEKEVKEITKIYRLEKTTLYSVKRNENTYIFIVVAENQENIKQMIQNLADAPKSFTGKYSLVKK